MKHHLLLAFAMLIPGLSLLAETTAIKQAENEMREARITAEKRLRHLDDKDGIALNEKGVKLQRQVNTRMDAEIADKKALKNEKKRNKLYREIRNRLYQTDPSFRELEDRRSRVRNQYDCYLRNKDPDYRKAVRKLLFLRTMTSLNENASQPPVYPTGREQYFNLLKSDNLLPIAGKWVVSDQAATTTGEEPPGGWYLRSRDQYWLKRLTVQLKKTRSDGIVMIYTRYWQIFLRKDSVTVKYAPRWPSYWYSITRPITFPADSLQELRLIPTGKALKLQWNGNEIINWCSPAAEWSERTINAGKLSGPPLQFPESLPLEALNGIADFVVVQSCGTELTVTRLGIMGYDLGAAAGFREKPAIQSDYTLPDAEIPRLAPDQPVAVNWQPGTETTKRAGALPPQASWAITNVKDTGTFVAKNNEPKTVDYLVGAEKPATFPRFLYGPRGAPQNARIFFNLEKAGDYTLQISWGHWGLGWGPNVLEVSVDGKPVSREVYRGYSQNRGCFEGRDFIPLKLNAGPHCIQLSSYTKHLIKYHFFCKYMNLNIGKIELVPGIHEPVFQRTAKRPYRWQTEDKALGDPPKVGEQAGKVINYCFTDLQPDQNYTVKLTFYEVDVRKPGQRKMDIFINDQPVEQDLDVLKTAGWLKYLEKSYPAKAVNGEINLRLKGKGFKAFVNAITITDTNGKAVYRENCGWTPNCSKRHERRVYHPNLVTPRPGPKPWTPAMVYDGHNQIPNPHFSLKTKEGRPEFWNNAIDFIAPTGKKGQTVQLPCTSHDKATITVDAQTGHQHPGSMKITPTGKDTAIRTSRIVIDYGKRQTFSFYAKSQGFKGSLIPEIYWYTGFTMDNQLRGEPYFRFVDKSPGDAWTGTTDWTQVSVTAKPPFGANVAVPVIRIEGDANGTIWIDDADLNGYGTEPLEITYSHIGYHPQSSKEIVVRSFSNAPVKWKLVDAKTNKTVQEGTADYHSYEWFSKRHYFTFDISDFSQPGSYRLEATQEENKVSSPTFPIEKAVYRQLAGKLLNGLHCKRMNTDLPGFRSPSEMDYAITKRNVPGVPRFNLFEQPMADNPTDALGGYYDAGDEIKHTEFWPDVLLATWRTLKDVKPRFSARTFNDAFDEFVWGAKAFYKFQLDDGYFLTGTKPQGKELDNIPLYNMDPWASGPEPLPQAAGVAALTARELKKTFPELSKRYLQVAENNYRANWDNWQKLLPEATPEDKLHYSAKLLFAEMLLWRLTNDPVYKERMDQHARTLATCLTQRAYLHSEELSKSNVQEGGITQDFIQVPCLFVADNPDHPAAGPLKEGLRTFADDVKKAASKSPWGQARTLNRTEDGAPTRFPAGQRVVGYWPALAVSLSEIGIILKDKALIRLAEKQLQWCLGKNFAGVSVVHGSSPRVFAGGDRMFDQAEFFNSWLNSKRKLFGYDGMVPSLSFRDIDGRGFCTVFLQADYPVHPGPTEYYLPLVADLLSAAATVHKALESVK